MLQLLVLCSSTLFLGLFLKIYCSNCPLKSPLVKILDNGHIPLRPLYTSLFMSRVPICYQKPVNTQLPGHAH
ncbi:hypothetical protein V8C26DRAFT_110832 [Trichoderma gracile]